MLQIQVNCFFPVLPYVDVFFSSVAALLLLTVCQSTCVQMPVLGGAVKIFDRAVPSLNSLRAASVADACGTCDNTKMIFS